MSSSDCILGRERGAVLRVILYTTICVALIGCTAPPSNGNNVDETGPRIIRQMDRPLLPANDGSDTRIFSGALGRGSLSRTGEWQARAEIGHSRLRCATYALGVRFGVGNATCSEVDWRSDMEWTPGRKQCNGATLIHSGGGRVDLPPHDPRSMNCVRVAVRCRGACG